MMNELISPQNKVKKWLTKSESNTPDLDTKKKEREKQNFSSSSSDFGGNKYAAKFRVFLKNEKKNSAVFFKNIFNQKIFKGISIAKDVTQSSTEEKD